ncbi:hypothetical protein K432DRAFT_382731 [Lepidopterella palustris CBS 459.81]|uniref:Serine hydrolase domain-containing protein n=1 Tax=Lepidopterella palustris CBS 459.81 TaxID=1314670 RepID=A0A8E2JEL0_9PEZI|nr:hypothetical protein K432DRAFT_382731 [Lepidopterella palustris CBS 459.81]
MAPQKPTLLALHGSGSNSTVFTLQLSRLARLLRPHFSIVFLNGPFAGDPGPGVLPFFEGCGPYYYWTVPSATGNVKGEGQNGVMEEQVVKAVMGVIEEVKGKGGEVVGVMGFSQGSRVVAGLLGAQEEMQRRAGKGETELKTNLKFGVSFMGSYPPPLMPAALATSVGENDDKEGEAHRIKTPTLHVQGALDKWSWAGKKMLEECFQPDSVRLLSVQADHHMPTNAEENDLIKEEILKLWRETM